MLEQGWKMLSILYYRLFKCLPCSWWWLWVTLLWSAMRLKNGAGVFKEYPVPIVQLHLLCRSMHSSTLDETCGRLLLLLWLNLISTYWSPVSSVQQHSLHLGINSCSLCKSQLQSCFQVETPCLICLLYVRSGS